MKNEKSLLDDKIVIRPMCKADVDVIAIDHCPPWSTIQETKDRWSKYYREQQENKGKLYEKDRNIPNRENNRWDQNSHKQ